MPLPASRTIGGPLAGTSLAGRRGRRPDAAARPDNCPLGEPDRNGSAAAAACSRRSAGRGDIASRLRITIPFRAGQLRQQFPFCPTCRARSSPGRDRHVCARPRRGPPKSTPGADSATGSLRQERAEIAVEREAGRVGQPRIRIGRSAVSSPSWAAGTRLRSVSDTLPISLASAMISLCFGVTSNVAVCATTASPALPSSR